MAHNRILVAADEAEILSEIAGDVPSCGGAVRAFNDNPDSIALVITNVRLPDGNGVDLARLVIDRSPGKRPCLLIPGPMSALYALVLGTPANIDKSKPRDHLLR